MDIRAFGSDIKNKKTDPKCFSVLEILLKKNSVEMCYDVGISGTRIHKLTPIDNTLPTAQNLACQ